MSVRDAHQVGHVDTFKSALRNERSEVVPASGVLEVNYQFNFGFEVETDAESIDQQHEALAAQLESIAEILFSDERVLDVSIGVDLNEALVEFDLAANAATPQEAYGIVWDALTESVTAAGGRVVVVFDPVPRSQPFILAQEALLDVGPADRWSQRYQELLEA